MPGCVHCALAALAVFAKIRLPVNTLQATNDSLKKRGVKGRLVAVQDRLLLRDTFTDTDAVRKVRRVPLGVSVAGVLEAESRAVALAAIINSTSAAERMLERLLAETGRLPQSATLTMDLLGAVGKQQEPGTRTRQECLKVAKRLAVLVGIDGTGRLDALHSS